jgi:phosphohistidine swiveling domain-containing protein
LVLLDEFESNEVSVSEVVAIATTTSFVEAIPPSSSVVVEEEGITSANEAVVAIMEGTVEEHFSGKSK